MRSSPAVPVPTPSLPVLRFLRSQSEQVGFFTPSRAATYQSSQSRGTRAKPWSPQVPSTSTRSLTTTPRHQATVESSLLNLDFLRPNTKTAPLQPLTFASAQRQKDLSQARLAATNRQGSTDSRPLLRRLWKLKEPKERTGLKTSDLPPLPSFLDGFGGANIARNKTGKAGNELKLRCTEFDVNGNVTLMDGEFKKSELIAKVRSSLREKYHTRLLLTGRTVWPSPARSQKNRFLPSSPHSRPPFGNTDQPPSFAGLDQARPRPRPRRIRHDRLLHTIAIHVRPPRQTRPERKLPTSRQPTIRISRYGSRPHQRDDRPGRRVQRCRSTRHARPARTGRRH